MDRIFRKNIKPEIIQVIFKERSYKEEMLNILDQYAKVRGMTVGEYLEQLAEKDIQKQRLRYSPGCDMRFWIETDFNKSTKITDENKSTKITDEILNKCFESLEKGE